MTKSKAIKVDLAKLEEKHNKQTEKIFKNILASDGNNEEKIGLYNYTIKKGQDINVNNILSYPTDLLLGLKELKNNSVDIADVYTQEIEGRKLADGTVQLKKQFLAYGYTGRVDKDALAITTLNKKSTSKIEKAVEKQITKILNDVPKVLKKGKDLTNYQIIKEPIDTSLTHANDVLSYPIVPLLTLNNLSKQGINICKSYETNIDGQDYLIINADLSKLGNKE